MAPSTQTHFSLAWDKYRSVMCSGFSVLQQNGEFVDMTIAADGHLVKVHQMVVGLASPYLKELIQSAPCPHPVIFLNNVSHQVLCSILEYVYTGEVAVPADKLQLFVETAKALHIKGLEDMMQFATEAQSQVYTHVPVEPIAVHTINKPGTNTLHLQVLGDKPAEIALPITARNIVMKRDMPLIHSPVPEKRRTLEVDTKDITEDMSYMEEEHLGGGDDGAADADDDVNTSEPATSAQNYKLSSVVSSPTTQQQGDMQYTISNRGALQLILNRYMYNLASRSKNGRTRRWKCVDYRNAKCPATASTEDNVVSSRDEEEEEPAELRQRFWRCVDYRHKRCPALLYTGGDIVMKRVAMHNHPFHDKRILAKIEKKAVFSAIKNAEEASTKLAEDTD